MAAIVVKGVVRASRSENGGLGGVMWGSKRTREARGDGETIADVESNECWEGVEELVVMVWQWEGGGREERGGGGVVKERMSGGGVDDGVHCGMTMAASAAVMER